ncbi:MAG: hypothetical protein ACOY0T_28930 [Myxococcota bacterium]
MDVLAGRQQFKRLKEEIPRLSRQARPPLAAACVSRIMPILSNHFGNTELFERALNLCWCFAAGEPVDVAVNKEVFAECDAKVDLLNADDQRGCTLAAVNTVIYALRSTYEPEAENSFDPTLQAQDAARGDASDDKESDAHLVEEADWQMKALDLISKTPPPYAKTWFREIDIEPKLNRKASNEPARAR